MNHLKTFFVPPALALVVALSSACQTPRAQAAQPASFSTEQDWIVAQVVGGIVDMSRLSAQADASAPVVLNVRSADPPAATLLNEATYSITSSIAGVPDRLSIVDHAWAAATYAPVARALFKPSPSPVDDARDENIIAALTTPDVDALLDASDRVSARLTSNPRSAAAHDDAALVVGALALKEPRRAFGDVRPALSRMSVHLAIADALDPATQPVSRTLATAIMLTLVNRQRDALRIVDDLQKSSSPDVRAWASALRLRITGDWRTLSDPESSTLLEQSEYLRAVYTRLSCERFLEAYDRLSGDDEAELRRSTVMVCGVESGNRFAMSGLQERLEEVQHVSSRVLARAIPEDQLVARLNEPPAPIGVIPTTGRVQVLDWTLWAGFLQRELCAQLAFVGGHYYWTLGTRAEGEAFEKQANSHFGGLLLYPIVSKHLARDAAAYGRAAATAVALRRDHPERVTSAAWDKLRDKPDFAAAVPPLPNEGAWLRPHVPTGTAFELSTRSLSYRCERPVDLEQTRRWAQAAPYEAWTTWSVLWFGDRKPTMEESRTAMGPLLEYDLDAVLMLYNDVRGTSEQYLQLARTMCALDADHCDRVAGQLVSDGREAEAAAAYEHWIATARNQVAVSLGVQWLVSFYEDGGRSARATELAKKAADVYSAGGLATYARLLDRRGNHAEAEKMFTQIDERYDDSSWLAAHYLREAHRTHDAAAQAQAESLMSKAFPRGIETATLQTVPTPPQDGIVFKTYGRRGERTGLRRDDVIVAVDGIRIHNFQQYWFAAQSSFDPHMRVIVWRDGALREVDALVPQRWFGLPFDQYAPAPRK